MSGSGKYRRMARRQVRDDLGTFPEFLNRDGLVEKWGFEGTDRQKESQAKCLIRECRVVAAEEFGVGWDYHREVNGFRVCPSNGASKVAREMAEGRLSHAAEATASVPYLLSGLGDQGYYTKASTDYAGQKLRVLSAQIDRTRDELEPIDAGEDD